PLNGRGGGEACSRSADRGNTNTQPRCASGVPMTDHRGHLAHTIGPRVPRHQLRRDRAHTRPVPHLGRRIRARRALPCPGTLTTARPTLPPQGDRSDVSGGLPSSFPAFHAAPALPPPRLAVDSALAAGQPAPAAHTGRR